MTLKSVEDELGGNLLPTFFQGGMSQIPRRAITGLPFKQSGIALPDPTNTVGANWTASCVIIGNLAVSLRGTAKFMSGDHALEMREGREEI